MWRTGLILGVCATLTACASAVTVMDRPEARHAGCLVLGERAWGPPPATFMAPDPIFVQGPDTVELQMRLARTGAPVVSGIGDSIRFSQEEIRRWQVLNDPLLVYPELSDHLEMSLATWRLSEGELKIQWTSWYVPVGERRGVGAELRIHLEAGISPLRGWALRSFHGSPFPGSAGEAPVGVDSVAVEAERMECPEEFPYESTTYGRRGVGIR